jgi:hypothetical protein
VLLLYVHRRALSSLARSSYANGGPSPHGAARARSPPTNDEVMDQGTAVSIRSEIVTTNLEYSHREIAA